MTQQQHQIEHAQAKVGFCPFCKQSSAELWFDPGDDFLPFQVRCASCGARGPRADCGWESAVPAWDKVRHSTAEINWRGPGSGAPDPHEPLAPEAG
jgi:hypothetical protein